MMQWAEEVCVVKPHDGFPVNSCVSTQPCLRLRFTQKTTHLSYKRSLFKTFVISLKQIFKKSKGEYSKQNI